VRRFLAAREIRLTPSEEAALAGRKDALFERLLQEQGVVTFASTIALIEALRSRGTKIGIVTSSRHGREVLQRAGIGRLFDARLDGIDLRELALKGKPDPDMFLRCAEALGARPACSAVFEDALVGVEAGRRGGFGLVVGVDRGGNAQALERAGADLVVQDLGELDPPRLDAAWRARQEAMAWQVEGEGFDPAREHTMESLFTVGNGYLGVRGALDMPLPGSHCDLFIAGVYDAKHSELPYSEIEFLAPERDDPYAELVPLPSPFRLWASVEGERLDFRGSGCRELRRRLDLATGVLHVEALFETRGGRRTLLRTRRCASAHDRHLLVQEAVLVPQNHRGALDLGATLVDEDRAARHPHLGEAERWTDGELELVRYETRASHFQICIASRTRFEPPRLRRLVSIFTSRDGYDARLAALEHVRSFDWSDFEALIGRHAAEWREYWRAADIRVPGQPAIEQALRFSAYHLRIAADEDPGVSVPARALSGRAYEGHVFWDAEIFMLPFYLHTVPALALNILLYRHHTLEGARRRAQEMGYRGACFAWESTVTGNDVTPAEIRLKSSAKAIPIFTGTQQIHVTADIAYAAWRYWEATRDEAFLAGPGAALFFETARFWASRVVRGGRHYHIRGVVGPDEYHHGVDDNAYTNWLARFNLERAAAVAALLNLHKEEADAWRALAGELYCPQPNEHGVIEQFAGFFELGDYALPAGERLRAPLSRLFDWDKVNRLKLIKQADVLMLPLLFPDAFPDDVVAANYRYYEPLTDHGSSLSPAVHAAIAVRIGLLDDAERYWKQALWLDLSNAMDNSALGVHPAAMAGTWQALVFGFLGVRFTEAGPEPAPEAARRLPRDWEQIELTLAWRGRPHVVKAARA
jgi:HAD superfamily hydrolase (TIGR01509 family)